MRIKTGSRALAALALVAALGVSGCTITMGSGSGKTSQASGEPSKVSDDRASQSDDSSSSDSDDSGSDVQDADDSQNVSGGGAITAPGTQLRFGDTAHLRINKKSTHNKGTTTTGTYDVTVTLEKGYKSDFDNAKNKSQFAGLTPYYVRIEQKLVSLSQKDAFGAPISTFKAYLENGRPAGKVTITKGQYPKCDYDYFDSETASDGKIYTKAGSTAKSCNFFVAKDGERVVAASWAPLDDDSASSAYVKNPIVWKE